MLLPLSVLLPAQIPANLTVHGEPLWRYTASHDFVAGDYLWTGISYLGETRWPSKGTGGGPLDAAGFKKDTWWYFRSTWNNKAATLHIAPAWNFKNQDGVYKQVVVYTNCEEVELYINDRLIGLDAGNMEDLSVWAEPERKMFSGSAAWISNIKKEQRYRAWKQRKKILSGLLFRKKRRKFAGIFPSGEAIRKEMNFLPTEEVF